MKKTSLGTSEAEDEHYRINEFQTDDLQFLAIKDSSNLDVLDEKLYSYDSAIFSLTPAVQNQTSDRLFRRVEEFLDSIPAAHIAKDKLQSKTEYSPRLDLIPKEIMKALQNGNAEIIPSKDATNAFLLQIRTTVEGLIINGKEYHKNKKIKDILMGVNKVPADVYGAMQCLSMQNQLNQISNRLNEISEACDMGFSRIIQGQRDDRIAKLISSRSSFIQALAISNEQLQCQMLLQAVREANLARAELAYQIKSDIALLGSNKAKAKEMANIVFDIDAAVVAMNNAVQISLYSYQALGERNAQLAVVKDHETFIKQVLLKEIEYKGNKRIAWNVIRSSGSGKFPVQESDLLPAKLLVSCNAFIGE